MLESNDYRGNLKLKKNSNAVRLFLISFVNGNH
jgi:hypothetical protein